MKIPLIALVVVATLVLPTTTNATIILSSNFDAHGSADGASQFTGISWATNGVSDPGSTIPLSSGATVQQSGEAANANRLAVARNIDNAGPWTIDISFAGTKDSVLNDLTFDYQFISNSGANQTGAHPGSGVVDVSILDAGLSPLTTVQIGPLGTSSTSSNSGTGIVADFPDVHLTSGQTYTLRFTASSNVTTGNNMAVDNFALDGTVIPEPTTLLIWSLLAGLGVGWRRRK